jgi:MoxR-like ATPase
MNPFDAVGTARISSAVYDRTCRLAMDYQDAADEAAIVARETGEAVGDREWVAKVVDLVRRTRSHPDLRIGSSVRGAIDTVVVAGRLSRLRGTSLAEGGAGLDAALVSLSGRVRVREGSMRTAEDVIRELWNDIFGSRETEPGKGGAPTGATTSDR